MSFENMSGTSLALFVLFVVLVAAMIGIHIAFRGAVMV